MSDITVALSNSCHMPNIYSCTPTIDKRCGIWLSFAFVLLCVCVFVL